MEERFAPSRPIRLGTRRRALRKSARSSAEGGLARAKRAASLDTDKQVETTVRDWMRAQETPRDRWHQKWSLHNQLSRSVRRIWQHYARAARGATTNEEADRLHRLSAQWEKTSLQLDGCQSQWVGYRAKCCGAATVPIAIPIGCNHRLCPLCCHQRSQAAQKRVRKMFDRLTHPALITLTIPNLPSIRKHNYTLFRQRVRQFIKQHGAWILGGVYSLETTYNRKDHTWHIHVHILADLASPLPTLDDEVKLADETVCRFTAIKWRLEFDWLRLWNSTWGKRPRKDCNSQARAGDEYDFEQWVRAKRKHSTRWAKCWNARIRKYVLRDDLSPREMERYLAMSAWNAQNTRVIDIKPVTDRDGAAAEVLKYITKVAMFSDLPEAIEPFVNAVKGARLIQTFGTWYGIKLDDEPEPEDELHSMKCACGCNDWKRMGIFYSRDVQFDPDGRYRLRVPHDHNSRGTVPRPTIRALDVREE